MGQRVITVMPAASRAESGLALNNGILAVLRYGVTWTDLSWETAGLASLITLSTRRCYWLQPSSLQSPA